MTSYITPTGFQSQPTKTTPVGADYVQLADSANNFKPVKALVSNLPSGGGSTQAVPATAAATTTDVGGTYSNGTAGVGATLTNAGAQAAFVADGYTAAMGDMILVQYQSNSWENGIYIVTDTGSPSTNWILTRWSGFDTAAQMYAGFTVYNNINGDFYYGQMFSLEEAVITIGTDPIYFYPPGVINQNPTIQGTVPIGQVSGGQSYFEWGPAPQSQVVTGVEPGVDVSYENQYFAGVYPNGLVNCAIDLTLATGKLYFIPFIWPVNSNLYYGGLYHFFCWSGAASPATGNNIIVGIYADSGGGQPIGDCISGNGSPTTLTTNSEITCALGGETLLYPGTYWLAYTIDGGSPQLYYNNAYSGIGDQIVLGYTSQSTGPTAGLLPGYVGYWKSFTYSTTFPTINDFEDLTAVTLNTETAGQILFSFTSQEFR